MKKPIRREKTLRRTLTFFMVLALVLPMLIFAMLSQYRIWRVSNQYLDERVDQDIQNMTDALDLALDKYSTLLYDFCTDDDVIELVENIDQADDELDVNSSNLRRQLVHICNRNAGVEAITLVTEEDKIFFYDQVMASSITSNWAGDVAIPDTSEGPVYHGVEKMIPTEEGDLHLFQIARRLVDYRDINRQIGTVIISINADRLQKVLNSGKNSEAFICEGNRIIAAENMDHIGQDISSIGNQSVKIRSVINETSGWVLYNYYSIGIYLEAFWYQTLLGLGVTVFMVFAVVCAIQYATSPLLSRIDELVLAMHQVQQGDFDVRVKDSGDLPSEVQKILEGFNSMVNRIGALIDRVKRSAEEQKNAELSAMEAQIDPHFLYNTLDTINWKALEKGEYDISNMVGALADILRYTIRNPGETVSIGQELYWLKEYTSLQAEKLEQPLIVETDVSEKVKTYRIHKLLLQPFVENSIKHGMEQSQKECRLKISIRLSGDQLHIAIKDNGSGMSQAQLDQLNNEHIETPGHVGLANVRKRLKLYYGEEATVFFESREGSYTRVHLFVKAICGEEEKH